MGVGWLDSALGGALTVERTKMSPLGAPAETTWCIPGPSSANRISANTLILQRFIITTDNSIGPVGCLYVCMCLTASMSPELHVQSGFVSITYGSVLLGRRCDILCTSSYMNSVVLSYDRRYERVDTVVAAPIMQLQVLCRTFLTKFTLRHRYHNY